MRHGYVEQWADWPWSSAAAYLARTDIAEVRRVWRAYPLKDYGKGWDEPEL